MAIPRYLEFARSTPSSLSQVVPDLTAGISSGTDLAKTIQDVKTSQQNRQIAEQLTPLHQALMQAQTGQLQAETKLAPSKEMLMAAQTSKLLEPPQESPLDALRALKLEAEIGKLKEPQPSLLEQEQTKQFSKDLAAINQQASLSQQQTIPKYQRLLKLMDTLPVQPGPLGGTLMLTSKEGQEFKSALKDAALDLIKDVHLGRMTQREFNYIQGILGSPYFHPEALKSIFNNQMSKAQMDIAKQQFANDYLKTGKKDPIEFETDWINYMAKKEMESNVPFISKGEAPNIDIKKANVTDKHSSIKQFMNQASDYIKYILGVRTEPSTGFSPQTGALISQEDESSYDNMSDEEIQQLLKERGLA